MQAADLMKSSKFNVTVHNFQKAAFGAFCGRFIHF